MFVGLWMLLAGTAALAPRLTGNSFDMLLPPLLTITGQWFLLRDRAWWATRWAVCGVVGALLPAVAAIVLHVLAPQSPLPRNQVYTFLLQVVDDRARRAAVSCHLSARALSPCCSRR